jgi:hypothetical protein
MACYEAMDKKGENSYRWMPELHIPCFICGELAKTRRKTHRECRVQAKIPLGVPSKVDAELRLRRLSVENALDVVGDTLTAGQLQAVCLRHGMAGKPKTFTEIGQIMGITRQGAQDFFKRGSKKLEGVVVSV